MGIVRLIMPKVLWTPEQAREMAIKGGQARKLQAELARKNPKVTVQLEPDAFPNKRLARVRYQLNLLDNEIEKELKGPEPDGQRIDRLAAASMRLNDQEFSLANRPKPAPLKMSSRQARQYQAPSQSPPPASE